MVTRRRKDEETVNCCGNCHYAGSGPGLNIVAHPVNAAAADARTICNSVFLIMTPLRSKLGVLIHPDGYLSSTIGLRSFRSANSMPLATGGET